MPDLGAVESGARRHVKPRDVGNGLVCGTFAVGGGWLSVGSAHPVHGFVELNDLPAFDPSWRGDPDAVRRYRGLMVEDRYAFLRLRWHLAACVEESVSAAGASMSAAGASITARYRITRASGDQRPIELHYHGRLDRHPYAEITDISPLPDIATTNRVRATGSQLRIEAPSLPAYATITVRAIGAHAAGWSVARGRARMLIEWGDADSAVIVVSCALHAGGAGSPLPAVRAGRPGIVLADQGGTGRLRTSGAQRRSLARIVRGTVAYVLGCTAVRVGSGEVCIITDHRILPLSWTRDAYYQALLLLCVSASEPRAAAIVADHLRWLWCRSRDQQGSWMRSHLTNGEVKDHGVQADQQLYPMLELCDYRRATGRWPDRDVPGGRPAAAWRAAVADAWARLPRDARTGLLSSEENPADDPSALPYTLSTQILYWYTAVRLSEWESDLDLGPLNLRATADRVCEAVDAHFTAPGPYGMQWSYESDLRDHRRNYNDANDLPTALAPLWGFCDADTPLWVATMRFTFGAHNPAYCAGQYSGLGSVHTPGTWPLGDVQQWIAASLVGDERSAGAAVDRLIRVAATDGLLPEAYDPDTGAWRARDWFAWPSAALGAVYLSDIDGDSPWQRHCQPKV